MKGTRKQIFSTLGDLTREQAYMIMKRLFFAQMIKNCE